MKAVNILILDLQESGDIGKNLQSMLNVSLQCTIQIHTELINDIYILEDNDLNNRFSQLKPQLMFLIFSWIHLHKVKKFLKFIKSQYKELPIIIVVEGCKSNEIVLLMKSGIADFIVHPFKEVDVIPRTFRFLEHIQKSMKTTYKLKEKIGLEQLVGKNKAFLKEIEKIPHIAKYDTCFLIFGETGTGKELCARAIHYLSPRSGMPFIPVNCGAIPETLVENELFGHTRGAYTGAAFSQPGLIHEANGGTLFLDEIESLPLPAQVKLLRFLQKKEYKQLGSPKIKRADIRIVAATNTDLQQALSEGKFRRDLFFRLNIIPLTLLPLRERKDDIPILAYHFLEQKTSDFNKKIMDFSHEALQKLILYDWLGNVRELENIVERAVIFAKEEVIQSHDILLPHLEINTRIESFQEAKSRMVKLFEKKYLQELLIVNHGNISKAARVAHKNRRAFWELLRKHNIDAKEFKYGYS